MSSFQAMFHDGPIDGERRMIETDSPSVMGPHFYVLLSKPPPFPNETETISADTLVEYQQGRYTREEVTEAQWRKALQHRIALRYFYDQAYAPWPLES